VILAVKIVQEPKLTPPRSARIHFDLGLPAAPADSAINTDLALPTQELYQSVRIPTVGIR
jgi:hypothetical protein